MLVHGLHSRGIHPGFIPIKRQIEITPLENDEGQQGQSEKDARQPIPTALIGVHSGCFDICSTHVANVEGVGSVHLTG